MARCIPATLAAGDGGLGLARCANRCSSLRAALKNPATSKLCFSVLRINWQARNYESDTSYTATHRVSYCTFNIRKSFNSFAALLPSGRAICVRSISQSLAGSHEHKRSQSIQYLEGGLSCRMVASMISEIAVSPSTILCSRTPAT